MQHGVERPHEPGRMSPEAPTSGGCSDGALRGVENHEGVCGPAVVNCGGVFESQP
jgi:hypothetical protein